MFGDPLVTYNLGIGNTYMRSWTSEESNWDKSDKNPIEYPYHPDTLKDSGFQEEDIQAMRQQSATF